MKLAPVTDGSVQLLRIIRNSCASYMTGNSELITEDEQAAWWLSVKNRPDFRVWISEIKGVPVGYGIIRERGERWWVTGGLLPEFRDQGHGRELFEALIALVEAEADCVWLDVRSDNLRAKRLYENLGFKMVEFSGDVYTMFKRKEPC